MSAISMASKRRVYSAPHLGKTRVMTKICQTCGAMHYTKPGYFCEVNGCQGTTFIHFDSKKEAHRYKEIEMMERLGLVKDIEIHPHFDLHAPDYDNKGLKKKIGRCYLDFKYYDIEKKMLVHEDTKGIDTMLSKWKRKHVEIEYGIKVSIL